MINKILNRYRIGKRISEDIVYSETEDFSKNEKKKNPSRTEIINFFLQLTELENYLEIGVRNPDNNFNKINCKNKYSVDPGIEFLDNPVSFKYTSDEFFKKLENNELEDLSRDVKFDLIFIDGLHLANQVQKDIENSLKFIKDEGFIVLHDCNPPSEYHQREDYSYVNSPAGMLQNGTTWKAFYEYRCKKEYFSICFDTDWGVGIISKRDFLNFNNLGKKDNYFFEFNELKRNRVEYLNLHSFLEWKKIFLKNESK